ncbi:MAG: TetR/AcrR family transcriptional regulator [Microbacterium arborescens]
MSPRPAKFTRDDAVAAAVAIVDDIGVDALTMRRLSAALGVDPMALYRHFADKGEVVAAVADSFWLGCEVPDVGGAADWRQYATSLMNGIRSSLERHPNVIPVVATHPITSAPALAWADRALGRIIDAGAPVTAGLGDLVNTLVMLTVASALGEYSPPAGSDAETGSSRRSSPRSAEPSTAPGGPALPNLARLAEAGWRPDPRRQFERALDAVLAGWGSGES